ncbi:unnamed protein product [Urochloa decumbens]|uniref:Bifunctional inhibitor/plant lipid transfer protein/seed storage helical domain-containing protein n=1 Tax=Urochloa decumbens TaxID=240449 RepID=A0ABC9EZK9_9POAL
MAPSSTFMLLIAFAVVAASLPPSAAARDGGAAKDAAAPAPSASGEAAVHPMGLIDDIVGGIIHFHLPDLPLPAIIPCPPAFPKIPLIPCYNNTPPRPPITECRTTIVKSLPACAGFLAKGSNLSSPLGKCCDGVQPFFVDFSTIFCFCHVINGDADKLLPPAVNHTRAVNLLDSCGFGAGPDQWNSICEQGKEHDDIPPMDAPTDDDDDDMDAPSPPPPRRH